MAREASNGGTTPSISPTTANYAGHNSSDEDGAAAASLPRATQPMLHRDASVQGAADAPARWVPVGTTGREQHHHAPAVQWQAPSTRPVPVVGPPSAVLDSAWPSAVPTATPWQSALGPSGQGAGAQGPFSHWGHAPTPWGQPPGHPSFPDPGSRAWSVAPLSSEGQQFGAAPGDRALGPVFGHPVAPSPLSGPTPLPSTLPSWPRGPASWQQPAFEPFPGPSSDPAESATQVAAHREVLPASWAPHHGADPRVTATWDSAAYSLPQQWRGGSVPWFPGGWGGGLGPGPGPLFMPPPTNPPWITPQGPHLVSSASHTARALPASSVHHAWAQTPMHLGLPAHRDDGGGWIRGDGHGGGGGLPASDHGAWHTAGAPAGPMPPLLPQAHPGPGPDHQQDLTAGPVPQRESGEDLAPRSGAAGAVRHWHHHAVTDARPGSVSQAVGGGEGPFARNASWKRRSSGSLVLREDTGRGGALEAQGQSTGLPGPGWGLSPSGPAQRFGDSDSDGSDSASESQDPGSPLDFHGRDPGRSLPLRAWPSEEAPLVQQPDRLGWRGRSEPGDVGGEGSGPQAQAPSPTHSPSRRRRMRIHPPALAPEGSDPELGGFRDPGPKLADRVPPAQGREPASFVPQRHRPLVLPTSAAAGLVSTSPLLAVPNFMNPAGSSVGPRPHHVPPVAFADPSVCTMEGAALSSSRAGAAAPAPSWVTLGDSHLVATLQPATSHRLQGPHGLGLRVSPTTPLPDVAPLPPSETVDNRRFPCPLVGCAAVFKTKHGLSRHWRSHTGEKRHACPYPPCTKAYAHRPALDYHIAAEHTGERKYKCEEAGCGAAFPGASALRVHALNRHSRPPSDVPMIRSVGGERHRASPQVTEAAGSQPCHVSGGGSSGAATYPGR